MRPPLRPDADVVAAFRSLTSDVAEPMLLLGVTPELADLSPNLTAIDRTQAMIDAVWPGDTPQRRARVGNWLKLRLPSASFASVVCDGGALAFPYPGLPTKVMREVANVLIPGGRFVTACSARPTRARRSKRCEMPSSAATWATFTRSSGASGWRSATSGAGRTSP
jgi:SAM-dependent methyltransferase